MYADGTILTLKTPHDPDKETKEPFAYNRVQVVGQSPISHAHKGKWSGADATGVILTPLTNFGGVLDEPFGKCVQLYDVESIPEVYAEVTETRKVRILPSDTSAAGPTPEEVFAKEAPGVAPEEGQIRARTARESPLGEPGGPADFHGPLGTVENDEDLTAAEIQANLDHGRDSDSPL